MQYDWTDLLGLHAETTLALLAFQVPPPLEAHAPEPHAARGGREGVGGAGGGFAAPGELGHLLDVAHRSNFMPAVPVYSEEARFMPAVPVYAVPVYTPSFSERGSQGCSRVSGGT